MGNLSGVDADTYARKDRVAYDLFVPNDLTVAGDLSVGGSLTVSGNINFSSTKSITKTYWFYNYQIIGAGITTTTFEGTDAFYNGPTSATPGLTLSASGSYYNPAVNVDPGEYATIPVEILEGQKLTKIMVFGGANTFSVSFVTVSVAYRSTNTLSTSSGIAATSSTLTRDSSWPQFTYNLSYTPPSERSHFIIVQNSTAFSQPFYRVVLTFESNNLFELLGIN